MNTFDRYLDSVRRFLPKARRDDIIRELEEDLRARMEARAAELGRPLHESEREAILEEHGSPMAVARGYHRHERRLAIGVDLIGPGLFPHYLKWLAIPVAITVVLFAAALLAGKRPAFSQFLFPIAVQFACVTLIFIGIEAGQRRYGWLDRWKPPSPSGPELVRRYLHAVRFWLPADQRDDIVAELAENLHSEIDERERALGRKLSDREVTDLLRARGEPVRVASNYMPPRYLIGPALFPVYRFVAKLVVLGILAPIYLLVVGPLTIKMAAAPSLAGVQALWNLLMSAFFSLGVVTLVFSILERHAHGDASGWDPRHLPRIPAVHPNEPEPVSRDHAVAGIVLSTLSAAIWVYLAQPQTALDFRGVRIVLAPVWRSLFWPILAVLLSGAVVGTSGLLRPNATRLHAGLRILTDALSVVVVAFLVRAHSWIQFAAPPGNASAGIEEADKWSNLGIWVSLVIIGVIALADGLREACRLLRGKRKPLHCLAGSVFLLALCVFRGPSPI